MNAPTNTVTVYSPRTGSHTFQNGQVWEEYDGPRFLGMYRNCDGRKVAVEWPAQHAWRYPLLQACVEAGIFDLGVTPRDTREFLEAAARQHKEDERLLAIRRDQEALEGHRRRAEVVLRGSWLVETWMGGHQHVTLHHSRKEAERAAQRPSEIVRIWQGSYALHRGGWISKVGSEFLVREYEEVDAA